MMESEHRRLLRQAVGTVSCDQIDRDLVSFVDDMAETCTGEIHSRQVMALAVETWKRMTGNVPVPATSTGSQVAMKTILGKHVGWVVEDKRGIIHGTSAPDEYRSMWLYCMRPLDQATTEKVWRERKLTDNARLVPVYVEVKE